MNADNRERVGVNIEGEWLCDFKLPLLIDVPVSLRLRILPFGKHTHLCRAAIRVHRAGVQIYLNAAMARQQADNLDEKLEELQDEM